MDKDRENEHLHGLGAVAEQQRGQLSPDWAPRFQRNRVLIKGMLNGPSFAQVPVGDKAVTSADTVQGWDRDGQVTFGNSRPDAALDQQD